jgi:hypothetical protein
MRWHDRPHDHGDPGAARSDRASAAVSAVFRGSSWDGWRSVLRAMTGAEMSPTEIEFFKSVAGDREPPTRRSREVWAICGRRAGKDSIASVVATHAAASFDPKGVLRPGERALVACIAPDRETARIIKNYINSYFELIPPLRALVQRTTDDIVELKNSVDISVMSSNFRTPPRKAYPHGDSG